MDCEQDPFAISEIPFLNYATAPSPSPPTNPGVLELLRKRKQMLGGERFDAFSKPQFTPSSSPGSPLCSSTPIKGYAESSSLAYPNDLQDKINAYWNRRRAEENQMSFETTPSTPGPSWSSCAQTPSTSETLQSSRFNPADLEDIHVKYGLTRVTPIDTSKIDLNAIRKKYGLKVMNNEQVPVQAPAPPPDLNAPFRQDETRTKHGPLSGIAQLPGARRLQYVPPSERSSPSGNQGFFDMLDETSESDFDYEDAGEFDWRNAAFISPDFYTDPHETYDPGMKIPGQIPPSEPENREMTKYINYCKNAMNKIADLESSTGEVHDRYHPRGFPTWKRSDTPGGLAQLEYPEVDYYEPA